MASFATYMKLEHDPGLEERKNNIEQADEQELKGNDNQVIRFLKKAIAIYENWRKGIEQDE